ncbi:MAG: VCBS repeat-containing protein [Patescibacteria group bacterium]|jgi:hypothetical protein
MPETLTQTKTKVRVGTLIGVLFAGAAMMAAMGYTVYKGAYKNEQIIPQSIVKKKASGPNIKDLFPVLVYKAGWPRSISGLPSRTTVGDIDADKKPEIIFGTNEHLVYALNDDGSEVPNWPIKIDEYLGTSVPAIGDLDLDGKLDVVISTNKAVYAFSGNADIKNGFPKTLDNLASERTPVISDITSDNKMEIAAFGDRIIYVISNAGEIVSGWPKETSEKISSDLATANLDSDTKSEIIFTSLSSGKNELSVLKNNGQTLSGYPKTIDSASANMEVVIGNVTNKTDMNIIVSTKEKDILVYSKTGEQLLTINFEDGVSDLALGDVDNNEIANISFANKSGVHVLGELGSEIKGWPKTAAQTIKYINLADINDDKNIEVLGTSDDRIYAWKNNGEEIRDSWPLATESKGGNFLTYPSLSDVDNNKVLEVISSLSDSSVYIWNLSDFFDKSGKAEWPMKRADVRNSGSL